MSNQTKNNQTPAPAVVDPNEMATAIAAISDGVAVLVRGGLKQRTIVALLHDMSGIGKRDIECVLHNLQAFKCYWTNLK